MDTDETQIKNNFRRLRRANQNKQHNKKNKMKTETYKAGVRRAAGKNDYFPTINGKRIRLTSCRRDLAQSIADKAAAELNAGEHAGFDANRRWGNEAVPGIGVNSPAMMEARAQFAAASHTPGPWGIGRHDDTGERVVRAADETIVANCESDFYPTCSNDEKLAQSEANARLIAAAPELLAALENILAEADFDLDGDSLSRGEKLLAIEDMAKAAIAKARGGK